MSETLSTSIDPLDGPSGGLLNEETFPFEDAPFPVGQDDSCNEMSKAISAGQEAGTAPFPGKKPFVSEGVSAPFSGKTATSARGADLRSMECAPDDACCAQAARAKSNPLLVQNPIYRGLAWLFYYGFAIPVLSVLDPLVFGLRVHGKEHLLGLEKTGAVLVCNHVHPFDCTFLGLLAFPRKCIFTSLERLFSVPVLSPLIRFLGSVPVPASPLRMRGFVSTLADEVKGGRVLCIYPEGDLKLRHFDGLRGAKDGAFSIAVHGGVPVVPVVITPRRQRGLYRLYKRRSCLTITALPPVYPPQDGSPRTQARKLRETVCAQMEQVLATAREGKSVQ